MAKIECKCNLCRRLPWVVIESMFMGSALTAALFKDWLMVGMGFSLVVLYEIIWKVTRSPAK